MRANAPRLQLIAPLSGVLIPIESVPDPVFAEKMVGDGISIDPTSNELLAPLAGTVIQLHRAGHALTIRSAEGVEVLLHIGLDTVTLKGEGFAPQVKEGDSVTQGQSLIRFDADLVGRKARGLLTQMVIANGDKVARMKPATGKVEAGKSEVLMLDLAGSSAAHTTSAGSVDLVAPLSGVLFPLDKVPDPVFAQKMVGDGVSLDPTSGELLSPVAGTVTNIHNAHHALTITTAEGLEVLVHIGIDTVMLKGEGFTPRVKQGDTVAVGQALISFDADRVARKAASLLTQIVIANGDKVAAMYAKSGAVEAGRDVVLSVQLVGSEVADATAGGNVELAGPVSLPNPSGLHARPAAVLAAEAKKYKSDVRIMRGAAEVNAKSVVAIMGFATMQGDAISVKATGPDAREAAAAVAKLLAEGCGEKAGDAPAPAAAPKVIAPTRATPTDPDELAGVSASPGLAVGRIVQYRQQVIEVTEKGDSPQRERTRLDGALHEGRAAIEALKANLSDRSKAQILDAHIELLEDPELIDLAIEGVSAGKSAGYAWREAFTRYAAQLEGLDNALLRERANDIRDVGRRVLALLAGVTQAKIDVPAGSILIAEELTPSDTAQLDRTKVLGFCTTTGGATSHVAILARSLGIPAVCGIDEAVLDLADGTQVVLDGSRGTLRKNPSEAQLADAEARMARQAAKREAEQAAAHKAAQTADGVRIEVVANVRNAKDAQEGVANGAEGVGLLRSEFLFDDRDTAPDEEEQAAAYIAVAEALGTERPLVVRTLDVGGDKPLPYLPLGKEDNPFLGLRGVRVSLDRPDMFRTQLRAILRTAPLAKLHIMFPMIATLEELREAKAILAEEQAATGHTDVQVGVMIEVPSAAVMAEQFAREADFFSIGTNDLTQYTLAMDRGHPKLAKKADGLNPAVLRMIALTCEGAKKHGKWVGVCGGMASDPMAVPVLIGLGVTELSASVPAIPAIKATVARVTMPECEALAQEVLALGTAAEVRARLAKFAD
ncbi:phosphoenolpyruvate--protein phosphotransferase [Niveibacterium umoris]|uniref:phosphoenolpyruvate--protein phosphotransferase n=1 Tax=Niveibacterium umoris TaxID=1193620 RepID=A0A840BH21_9RHOO|nr:phosphoenolpyruvate--protein phosphotransferase [Niveibacterium umoris]MBB4012270.1 phosphocarrier protein FPr/phosphocarrier protein [Niveibacterium umoris]